MALRNPRIQGIFSWMRDLKQTDGILVVVVGFAVFFWIEIRQLEGRSEDYNTWGGSYPWVVLVLSIKVSLLPSTFGIDEGGSPQSSKLQEKPAEVGPTQMRSVFPSLFYFYDFKLPIRELCALLLIGKLPSFCLMFSIHQPPHSPQTTNCGRFHVADG